MKKITVRTLMNGYSLDVEGGKGYMYTNIEDLVIGMVWHCLDENMASEEQKYMEDCILDHNKNVAFYKSKMKALKNQQNATSERLRKSKADHAEANKVIKALKNEVSRLKNAMKRMI